MIEKISYIESSVTSPYQNLAMEEYLLLHCLKEECILYLWQNQHTIVIGKNQNAWKECRVNKLEEEGGHLARRLSGGGAVYHDLGNLNFTFVAQKENYDVEKQTEVILRAIQKLGLQAEKTGRNDIVIDGKKFSGHAYCEQGVHCYHHGTIMVDVNKNDLSRYLTVAKEKLQSKGVDSVRSRVCNLKEYLPDLTIDELKAKLIEAFEEIYGHKVQVILESDIHPDEFAKSLEKFSSWEWKYGQKIKFQYELTNKFTWGLINLQFTVQNGRISEIAVYSDAMITGPIEKIAECLNGVKYTRESICERLNAYSSEREEEMQMITDLEEWISNVEL